MFASRSAWRRIAGAQDRRRAVGPILGALPGHQFGTQAPMPIVPPTPPMVAVPAGGRSPGRTSSTGGPAPSSAAGELAGGRGAACVRDSLRQQRRSLKRYLLPQALMGQGLICHSNDQW